MTSFTRKQFERTHRKRHAPKPPPILRKSHFHEDKRRQEEIDLDELFDDDTPDFLEESDYG